MVKCLIEKAKEECQCEKCKNRRYWESMGIVVRVQQEVFSIISDALSEKRGEK